MTKTIYDPRYARLINHLRRRRRELSLRQQDVADKLGVTRSWVGKVEQRERRLDVLELYRLCEIYRIEWAELEPLLKERP